MCRFYEIVFDNFPWPINVVKELLDENLTVVYFIVSSVPSRYNSCVLHFSVPTKKIVN